MRLKIYDEKRKDPEIFLRLVDLGSQIAMECCDYNGERLPGGALLYIKQDGSGVILAEDIDKNLGFKLTYNNSLKLIS